MRDVMRVPTGPGLGIEPDPRAERALRACRD
jgi:L-alanine-DL-glutamate epimerase-like enolase superfamily enzyme